MTTFYANVLLTTTGGSKREAASRAKDAATKWRALDDMDGLEFGEPDDYNNDVEGFAEWTTSFDLLSPS